MMISEAEFSKRLGIGTKQAEASLQAITDGGYGFKTNVGENPCYSIDDEVLHTILNPDTTKNVSRHPRPSKQLLSDMEVPRGAADTISFIGYMGFLDYRNTEALYAAAPWIARRMGRGLRTVRQHLQVLERNGYIGTNITRRWWMTTEEFEEEQEELDKLQEEFEELRGRGETTLVSVSEWRDICLRRTR